MITAYFIFLGVYIIAGYTLMFNGYLMRFDNKVNYRMQAYVGIIMFVASVIAVVAPFIILLIHLL